MRMQPVKIGLLLFLLVTMTSSTFAQPGTMGSQDPRELLEKRIAKLDSLLDLSDNQEAEIMRINLEVFEAGQEAVEESRGDRRSLGETMRELRQRQETQVLEVLDDDQREDYLALLEKEREEMRRRFPHQRRR